MTTRTADKNKIPQPLEKDIKQAILGFLLFHNCFAWPNDSVGIFDQKKRLYRKNKSPYHINGVADILGIWRGKPLAIEVKRKGTYPSPEQKIFIERFTASGGIAFIARSVDDVKQMLLTENDL